MLGQTRLEFLLHLSVSHFNTFDLGTNALDLDINALDLAVDALDLATDARTRSASSRTNELWAVTAIFQFLQKETIW